MCQEVPQPMIATRSPRPGRTFAALSADARALAQQSG
jgi:hypothetical protein